MTAGRRAAPAPLADEGLGARASPSGHRPQLRQPCVRDELHPGSAEKDTGQPPSPSLVIASERWGSVGCPQRCPRCPAWTSQLRRGGMKRPSLPEAGTMPLGSAFLLLLFVRPPPDSVGAQSLQTETLCPCPLSRPSPCASCDLSCVQARVHTRVLTHAHTRPSASALSREPEGVVGQETQHLLGLW